MRRLGATATWAARGPDQEDVLAVEAPPSSSRLRDVVYRLGYSGQPHMDGTRSGLALGAMSSSAPQGYRQKELKPSLAPRALCGAASMLLKEGVTTQGP